MSKKTSSKGLVASDKVYQNLLSDLKSIITKGHYKAYKAVDNIRVQTYWQLGERIVREELKHEDRAVYGKYLIDNLMVDLDIGRRLLYRIVKFYRTYPIVSTLRTQLSWAHYRELIVREDSQEREFYENKIIINSWSVRNLSQQIKAKLYEKTPKKDIQAVFQTKLPAIKPQEVFKETYDFKFIELRSEPNEKELEEKILGNFEKFLKALGQDFAILGRQVPIKIDQQTHLIDMVLYHRGIPCVVLADLKVGKLDSRDIGQMNKYIGYWRLHKQYEHEQPTIGLIICREAGREEVIYALDGLEEKIFIAKYKVKLPSEANIKKAFRKLGTKNKKNN
jgi:predicted nuclease of restriction endonuclease-like (RecB) superfamily